MPVKLVFFLLILIMVGTFVGFNIGHTSDISFWPSEKGTLTDVPILVSFFVMYIVGVLSVIPFFVGSRYRKDEKKKIADAKKAVEEAKESKNVRTGGTMRVLGTKASRDKSEVGSEQKDEVE